MPPADDLPWRAREPAGGSDGLARHKCQHPFKLGGRFLVSGFLLIGNPQVQPKPAPNMRSFSERLIHAAAANYFFINPALGQKLPPAEDPPRAQFKNKTAVVEYVQQSFADGASAIQAKADPGISDLVVDPFGYDDPQHAGKAQIRLSDLAHNMIEHSGEVYGQLTVYYRAEGPTPPESRPRQ